MNLRAHMARLRQLACDKFGIGKAPPLPLVIECHLRGDDEQREPGVHWVDVYAGHMHPEVVIEPGTRDEEDAQRTQYLEALRAELKAGRNWKPLVVTCHRGEVPAPADLPTE